MGKRQVQVLRQSVFCRQSLGSMSGYCSLLTEMVHFRMAKCLAKVMLGICGRAVIFLQCQIFTAKPRLSKISFSSAQSSLLPTSVYFANRILYTWYWNTFVIHLYPEVKMLDDLAAFTGNRTLYQSRGVAPWVSNPASTPDQPLTLFPDPWVTHEAQIEWQGTDT